MPAASPSSATTKGRSLRMRGEAPHLRAGPRWLISRIRTATFSRLLEHRVPECGHRPPVVCETADSPSCLEQLSEKGSEQGFDRRFDQYRNPKTARKVPFQYAVRPLVGASATFRTV